MCFRKYFYNPPTKSFFLTFEIPKNISNVTFLGGHEGVPRRAGLDDGGQPGPRQQGLVAVHGLDRRPEGRLQSQVRPVENRSCSQKKKYKYLFA